MHWHANHSDSCYLCPLFFSARIYSFSVLFFWQSLSFTLLLSPSFISFSELCRNDTIQPELRRQNFFPYTVRHLRFLNRVQFFWSVCKVLFWVFWDGGFSSRRSNHGENEAWGAAKEVGAQRISVFHRCEPGILRERNWGRPLGPQTLSGHRFVCNEGRPKSTAFLLYHLQNGFSWDSA